jgi:Mat/Ecp fimbriae major subunit
MKRVSEFILLVVMLIVVPKVLAQVSSTVTGIGIDAKVIAPISIENTGHTPMDFGTVSRSSTAGTVTVTPAGGRSATGGVSVLSSSSFSAAPFHVTGENNASFNITKPLDNTVVLTRSGGSETMAVNGFDHNSTLALSGTGSETFSIGATLYVNADQLAGEYTGSFAITVAYQ